MSCYHQVQGCLPTTRLSPGWQEKGLCVSSIPWVFINIQCSNSYSMCWFGVGADAGVQRMTPSLTDEVTDTQVVFRHQFWERFWTSWGWREWQFASLVSHLHVLITWIDLLLDAVSSWCLIVMFNDCVISMVMFILITIDRSLIDWLLWCSFADSLLRACCWISACLANVWTDAQRVSCVRSWSQDWRCSSLQLSYTAIRTPTGRPWWWARPDCHQNWLVEYVQVPRDVEHLRVCQF